MQRMFRGITTLAAFCAGLASLAGCGTSTAASEGGDAGEPSVENALVTSCKVTDTTCAEPAPHYADIAGILDRSCNPCHTGVGNAPWALTDYDHVSAWSGSIQQDLSACTMPPLDGGIAMTATERLEILTWVECGALP